MTGPTRTSRDVCRGAGAAGAVAIAKRLGQEAGALTFAPPVTHVYNPLDYAWASHRRYLERFAAAPREILLVGMNPGPFGMAQTGVPFGDVAMVRDWIGIEAAVERPCPEHPKRPVLGFACTRSEVSGTRVWGWARERFASPERFFARFLVWNYCPLSFMEASGRNRTPDKLPPGERAALFAVCDRALAALVHALAVKRVVGIGRFAAARIERNRELPEGVATGGVPHPSPASPVANRGWAALCEAALAEQGVVL